MADVSTCVCGHPRLLNIVTTRSAQGSFRTISGVRSANVEAPTVTHIVISQRQNSGPIASAALVLTQAHVHFLFGWIFRQFIFVSTPTKPTMAHHFVLEDLHGLDRAVDSICRISIKEGSAFMPRRIRPFCPLSHKNEKGRTALTDSDALSTERNRLQHVSRPSNTAVDTYPQAYQHPQFPQHRKIATRLTRPQSPACSSRAALARP
jgi:hypothetical protein